MKKLNKFGKRTDYPIEEIGDGVYRIDEFGLANCYLVVGEFKALLIDCGVGIGDLLGAIRTITSLPIIAAVTHAHCDHIGGAGQFETIYVPKGDCRRFFRFSNYRFIRKSYIAKSLTGIGFCKKDVRKCGDCKWLSFDGGHKFELGGRTVTTVHTAGHTVGSVIFLDEKSKIMFTGDNANISEWLFFPCSTSVEEWLVGVKLIYAFCSSYTPYCGHLDGLQKLEQIAKTLDIGEELLRFQPKNKKLLHLSAYPKFYVSEPHIIYRKGNVHIKK